ncbi:DNA circularization protein [Gilliamella sp. CG13]|uniref:DNA circularization protein n=1 Tax=Gilliamella sp. CG13 TaxID=3351502 RepID=UPI0039871981
MLDILRGGGTKNIGRGSFRGVPFYVIDEAARTGGNRLIRHEYPLRDVGLVENMGRTTASTTINVVVVGDDCRQQADTLIDALDSSESGELQHPDFKTQLVYVEQWSSRTVASEQRVVYFSVTFVPDTDEQSPVATPNGISIMGALSDVLGEGLVSDFVRVFDAVGEAVLFIEDCLAYGEAIANGITNAIRGAVGGSGLSSLLGRVKSYQASLRNLFKSPQIVARELRGLLGGIEELCRDNRQNKNTNQVVEQLGLARRNIVTPPAALLVESGASTTQILESVELNVKNATATKSRNVVTDALQLLVDMVIATEVAKIAVQDAANAVKTQQPEIIVTYNDCQRVIGEHGNKLQELIIASSDAYWYKSAQALRGVRQAFVAQLEALSIRLPAGKIIALSQTEPALVALYRETGNAAPVGQFIRRNGLRHPTFAVGGTSYEVIENE